MNQLDGRPPLHWKRWVRKRVPAIKSLIAALSDEEREVRLAAVSALSRIGIPAQRAAPALIKLIELGGMSKDDPSEVDDAGIVLDDYEDVRWAGWEADVRSLNGDQAWQIYPFLSCSGPPISERHRSLVDIEAIYDSHVGIRA